MRVVKGILKGLRLLIDFVLLTILLGLIFIGYYVYNKGYIYKFHDYYKQAKQIVADSSVDDFIHKQTGVVYYDADDNVIYMTYGGRYLEYDEIPKDAINAIVAIEDNRFFKHNGVDVKGIARAIYYRYKSHGTNIQGGSTITQQLMKLTYVGSKRTYERKILEAFTALLFEIKYTKKDILEYYLNNIYFANQYYGIDAAAYGYFGKDSTQLSLAQLTFILAIPNSPTKYDPYENPSATKGRQERILKAMCKQGYIDEDTYVEACAEDIILNKKGTYDVSIDNTKDYPFSYIQREAVRALMRANGFEFKYYFDTDDEKKAYNESYDEAYNIAKEELNHGYVIHTSISKTHQNLLQNCVDEFMAEIDTSKNEEGVYEYQASAVSIDNATGMVDAIVGGRTDKSYLNRAYQSYRQPGSCIKPILVYTPAIELKGYDGDSIVNDHPLKDGCTNANGRYLGHITLRTAVSSSINTIAWQLFEEIGPKTGLAYLKNMHFAKIVKADYQLAASVGGFTYGVSTLEMASAYSSLYNDGEYKDPTCVVSIYDSRGRVKYSNDELNKRRHIYKAYAAKEMVNIMTSVFSGTARGLAIDGFCAGKTGTTNDSKDSWFCGMNDDYTMAVWVGRDDARTMGHGVTGAGYAGHIWHNYFVKLYGNAETDTEEIEGVVN